MKLTKKNLQDLLNMLGVQDVEIVEENGDEFNHEELINGLIETRKPILLQQFETEILPEKIKAEAGKFGGNLKNTIKKMSNGFLKDSDLAGKKDEEVLQMFHDFLSKDKDSSNDELRSQIKSLSESQEAMLEQLKADYEGKLSAKDNEFSEFHIKNNLAKLIGEMPLVGENHEKKVDILLNSLKTNYNPIWNKEKNEIELRDKENAERLALLNENTILTPKMYSESFFKELGMIKADTRDEKATNHVDIGRSNQNSTDTAISGQPFAEILANL